MQKYQQFKIFYVGTPLGVQIVVLESCRQCTPKGVPTEGGNVEFQDIFTVTYKAKSPEQVGAFCL
jgi:hypothetical protein